MKKVFIKKIRLAYWCTLIVVMEGKHISLCFFNSLCLEGNTVQLEINLCYFMAKGSLFYVFIVMNSLLNQKDKDLMSLQDWPNCCSKSATVHELD